MKNQANLGLFLFFALILSTGLSYGQTNISRSVGSFTKVNASGNIEVILKKGDSKKLNIEASNISSTDIISEVHNDELRLKLKTKIYKNIRVVITVYYEQIRHIRSGSSALVKADSAIEIESIKLEADTNGNMELPLEVSYLDVSTNSGGTIILRGHAQNMQGNSSAGGSIDAYDLKVSEAFVKANTGGNIEINATDKLEAKASTGASIHYSGDPKVLDYSNSLGGKVEERQ
ncbi:head GIN domain-containing protein [Aureibacter tunicatorum]|uniref:Putative auto-transporter adhesin head GIN domain-containing protein n=1 Tax=Aureibacter tunicatorum TaxID=866807 RepID=A0AAE4BUQ4_9BACT|nr:head GIN domain-containing protein [Aureibacter tunicatorum]MDR6241315.1 hypothetical protein [Aureibacter tunicatorum]BDD03574.1 hypothetical protein AUTU_10570 [Aureibacter tunicatorum]